MLPSKKPKNQPKKAVCDQVPENLKCPVCFEVLLPPIYQCELGHNICNVCVENVHQCPLCKEGYGDTRNYFAEDTASKLTLPCKYQEYGCEVILPGSQLKAHQERCPCQPYRCPELACKEMVGFKQMSFHLQRHGFKEMRGETHLAQLDIQDGHFDKKTEYNPWRISAFDREFFAVTTRQNDGNWFFWTWLLGLQEEAKKFSSEVVLVSPEKDVIYRGPVHSLRVSPDEIMKGGCGCLVIGDELIKSLRKNGQVTCGVRFIEGKNWNAKKLLKAAKKSKEKQEKQVVRKKTQQLTFTTFQSEIAQRKEYAKKILQSPLAQQMPKTSKLTSSGNTAVQKLLAPRPKTSNASKLVATMPLNLPPKSTSKPRRVVPEKSKALPAAGDRVKATTTAVVAPKKSEDSELMKNLKQSLRCPGCQEVIAGAPIWQCLIGHNICADCKTKRKDCPLCRSPIGQTRNFFCEELLYKAYQQCRFHCKGCNVCLPVSEIRLHETNCLYAPFECPFETCYQQISATDLLEHLKSHQIDVVEKELSIQIPVPKPNRAAILSTIPSIIQHNGAGFYPVISRDKHGSWAFWVSSAEHGKYQYEVMLKKQSKTVVFHAPVNSLRATHTQVRATGSCLLIHDRVIKSLKNANGKFDFSVKVTLLDGQRTTSEAFAVPLFYEKKAIGEDGEEQIKLFANSKTSEASADDSYEASLNRMRLRDGWISPDENGDYILTVTESPSGYSLEPFHGSTTEVDGRRASSASLSDDEHCYLKYNGSEELEEDVEPDEEHSSPESKSSKTSAESFRCPTAPKNSYCGFNPEVNQTSDEDDFQRNAENDQRIARSSPSFIMKILAKELERVSASSSRSRRNQLPATSQSQTLIQNPDNPISRDSSREKVQELEPCKEKIAGSLSTINLQGLSKEQILQCVESQIKMSEGTSLEELANLRDSLTEVQKSGSADKLIASKESSDEIPNRNNSGQSNHAKLDTHSKDDSVSEELKLVPEKSLDASETDTKLALKPTRSCLKVPSQSNSTESLASKSKQLRVKFADEVEQSDADEPVEEIPLSVSKWKDAKVLQSSSSENFLAEASPSQPQSPLIIPQDQNNNNEVWDAESDLAIKKSRPKKKKKKNVAVKNRLKRSIPIGKRKARVSLLDVSEAETEEFGTEYEITDAPSVSDEDRKDEDYDFNGNYTEKNDKDTNGPSTEQQVSKKSKSDLLIDLADAVFDAKPNTEWSCCRDLSSMANHDLNIADSVLEEDFSDSLSTNEIQVAYFVSDDNRIPLQVNTSDFLHGHGVEAGSFYDETRLLKSTGPFMHISKSSEETATPDDQVESNFPNEYYDVFEYSSEEFKPEEEQKACQVGSSLMDFDKNNNILYAATNDDDKGDEDDSNITESGITPEDNPKENGNTDGVETSLVRTISESMLNIVYTVKNFFTGFVSDPEENEQESEENAGESSKEAEGNDSQYNFDVDNPFTGRSRSI